MIPLLSRWYKSTNNQIFAHSLPRHDSNCLTSTATQTNYYQIRILHRQRHAIMNFEKERLRPLTAYMLFCGEQWVEVRDLVGSRNGKRIIPEIARRWRELGPEEKARLKQIADAEKLRFYARRRA
jgi:hypothetical protein